MDETLQERLRYAIDKTGRGVFLGENLDAMRAYYEIARHNEARKIDLCYIDPPFNSKRNYNVIYHDSVADEKVAQRGFSDVWSKYNFDTERKELALLDSYTGGQSGRHKHVEAYLDCVQHIATESHVSYLHFMAVRVWYIWLLLKDTGSFYLHCDPTMSHYLKQLCDIIFGVKCFRNEIVWGYRTGGVSKERFPRKHDIILSFGRCENKTKHNPLQERIYYEKPFFNPQQDESGRYYADVYVRDVWDSDDVADEFKIKPVINVSKERKGYPTQKPEALLERIIKASSNEGDLVVDFFAGAGTAACVAERLGRRWLAFDKSPLATQIISENMPKQPKRSEKAPI